MSQIDTWKLCAGSNFCDRKAPKIILQSLNTSKLRLRDVDSYMESNALDTSNAQQHHTSAKCLQELEVEHWHTRNKGLVVNLASTGTTTKTPPPRRSRGMVVTDSRPHGDDDTSENDELDDMNELDSGMQGLYEMTTRDTEKGGDEVEAMMISDLSNNNEYKIIIIIFKT